MPLQQESRLLAVRTALGPGKLAIRAVTIHEQLGRLTQVEAELSSEDGQIEFAEVVGRTAGVRLDLGTRGERFFNGIISRFTQVANEGAYAHYRAVIVPWPWCLTRNADCRIFQNRSVPQILEDVFSTHGFADYELRLSRSYATREFCVQYRETDFNFMSRLLEQEGIYYFFEQKDDKEILVLADSISAHAPVEGYEEIPFQELERGAPLRESIFSWAAEQEVQPVTCALNDFDFTKPRSSLRTSASTNRDHGQAKYEVYDYPGEYVETDDGNHLSDVRLNEFQSQQEVFYGHASARGLAAGATFKLKHHPRSDQNREFLITSVKMRIEAAEYASQSNRNNGAGDFFTCSFTAIDKTRQFRPPRTTPKPVVQGPQTAMVVGPEGEEIYTDEHGRVKVQFHWDRYGKADQDSSCWVRVSQTWAGKQWGAIHIPRMGQEVIVEFLEGDPDRPIITGRVYNAEQVPPYSLPANKTQSGIKSRSSKQGSTGNFNEIRFEDKKGSEQVYIHAEKNQDNVVENDETTNVGHDRTEEVGHDESVTIGNDQSLAVGRDRDKSVANNESTSIGANRSEDVGKNETISIGVNRSTTVGSDEQLDVGGKRSKSIGKDEACEIGENRTQSVAKNETLSVGENLKQTIGKSHSIKVSKDFSLEATEAIVLKTGSASITMKKDGTIQIKGKDVSIEGSGKIQVKASGDVIIKGSKVAEN